MNADELKKLLEESLGFPVTVAVGVPNSEITSLYCKGKQADTAGPLHISSRSTRESVIAVLPMLRVMFEDAVAEADYQWRIKHQKRGKYQTKKKR